MINNPLEIGLTPKHRHFVEAYIQTQGNAPEAPPESWLIAISETPIHWGSPALEN